MLEHANPGNAPRKGCLLWFVCMAILGAIIVYGMKYCTEWADNLYNQEKQSTQTLVLQKTYLKV